MARSGSPQRRRRRGILDRFPVVPGAVAGAVAFAIGYGVTYLLSSETFSSTSTTPILEARISGVDQTEPANVTAADLAEGQSGSAPSQFEGAGWLFHKAHFASIDATYELGGSGGSGGENGFGIDLSFVAEPNTLVYVLVPVLLVGAGLLVARREDVVDASTAATAGATVVAGYLPLALASAFLTEWSVSSTGNDAGMTATVSISPNLVMAGLLVGLAYPAVFGALGGVAAASLDDRSGGRRADRRPPRDRPPGEDRRARDDRRREEWPPGDDRRREERPPRDDRRREERPPRDDRQARDDRRASGNRRRDGRRRGHDSEDGH